MAGWAGLLQRTCGILPPVTEPSDDSACWAFNVSIRTSVLCVWWSYIIFLHSSDSEAASGTDSAFTSSPTAPVYIFSYVYIANACCTVVCLAIIILGLILLDDPSSHKNLQESSIMKDAAKQTAAETESKNEEMQQENQKLKSRVKELEELL